MVHLLVVTAGIIVALGLEQSVEAFHHHRLAAEARDNMLTEIGDNKKDLDKHLAKLAEEKKEREADIDVIDRFLANKNLAHGSMAINFSPATLNSASWATASTVGALAYMEYGQVKQFAQVYKKQEFFDRLQDEEIKDVQVASGMMASFDGPAKPAGEELRTLRRQLLQGSAALEVLRQLGEQLSAEYDKVLHK